MALSKEQQDQKDYQDYVAYQKYVESQQTKNEPSFLNTVRGTVEGLERGLTGGLSDAFQSWGHKKVPALFSSDEERQSRETQSPVLSKLAEKTGGLVMSPVTTVTDSLGVPDGPEIFPHNDYLNPTYGGVAKGVGDIMVMAPEMLFKTALAARPMLSKLSGLTAPQIEAYIKNSGLVNKIKGALESQKLEPVQKMAGEALSGTVDKLKTRGTTRADVAAKMLEGRAVDLPIADVQALADSGSATAKKLLKEAQEAATARAYESGIVPGQLAHDVSTINVQGGDVYALTQDAGKAFKESGGMNPLTGKKVAQDPNLGRIFTDARGKMAGLDVGPTVDELRKRTASEIKLQKAFSPKVASDSPLQILNTSSPDQLARMDRAAGAGASELQDLSNSWQAAKNLSRLEYGAGAPGISSRLHGVSPKVTAVQETFNSLFGGFPQKAALELLPLSEAGKTSPWLSLESAFNPWNAPRIISNTAKEKKENE